MHQAQFALASALAVFLVVGGCAQLVRGRALRGFSGRDLLLLVGCLAIGLAVRLSATPFIASTFPESAQGTGIDNAHRWAAGLSAVLHFLFLYGPPAVRTVAAFNVFVSLATIAALYVFVDTYFEDRFAALSAAVVLALQPVSARYAASDSSAVLQTFCLVCGAAYVARWSRSASRWHLVLGVGWLVFAANVRYESLVYPIAGALLALGGDHVLAPQRRGQLALGGLICAVFLLYPVGRALSDASRGVFELWPTGYLGVFVLGRDSPKLIVAVAFLGLAWSALVRFRKTVCYLLALVVVSLPGYFIDLECADLNNRFALAHLAFWAGLAGCGFSGARSLVLERLWPRKGQSVGAGVTAGPSTIAAAAVVAVTLAAAMPHRGMLTRVWTHTMEYDFLVSRLREIPDECLMIGPDSDDHARGLRINGMLSTEAGRRHRWRQANDPAVLAGHIEPCTVYYRATACHGYEATLAPQNPDWPGGGERPVCTRIAELYELEPIATATIPSRGYMCEAHTVDPVPVGLYRVRPRTAPDAGGGS